MDKLILGVFRKFNYSSFGSRGAVASDVSFYSVFSGPIIFVTNLLLFISF